MLPLHAFPNQECAIGQQIHTVLGQAFATVEQAMEAALQRTTLAGLMESLQAKVAA
jgi:DNA-binding IscR family transcriptional regulator